MKPLSFPEVVEVSRGVQTLVGAQLQDVMQTSSGLGLGFYHQNEVLWIWVDLHPGRPLLAKRSGKPVTPKKIDRPLMLFLRAHFVGRRLAETEVDPNQGRILRLRFHLNLSEESPCELEIRLFPHGQNIIARFGNKSVAERKPKELELSSFRVASVPDANGVRSWDEISREWQEEVETSVVTSRAKKNPEDVESAIIPKWNKLRDKKLKVLNKIREDHARKVRDVSEWASLGHWLKQHQTLEAPEEWRERLDPDRGLAWNIENSFRHAKSSAKKVEGSSNRLRKAEQDHNDFVQRGPTNDTEGLSHNSPNRPRPPSTEASSPASKKRPESLLARARARGRRLSLSDDLEAYIGKSAADNLALLRRAQPFDYWLHLRDHPGAHAVIRRTRNRRVIDSEFLQVGRWVAEQSLGKRVATMAGERLDLLIVECRYVRPIKGDRLGRVHYTHDRVLSLRL